MTSPTPLPAFTFQAPHDLSAALQLLAEAGPSAAILAGGTDLMVKMKLGQLRPATVVSLDRVAGLDRIEPTPQGGLRIGSLVTMARLAESEALQGPWVGLAEGAAVVGGPVIRNRATVGGNIVNARPCADTVPPLVTLGAQLHLARAGGERQVALDGFVVGPGQTRIEPGEVLRAIELPPPDANGMGSAYLKITRRAAMEITVVGCGVSLCLTPDHRTIVAARIVFTSVAPVPLRVRPAEELLEGQPLQAALLARAAARAGELCQPIDDHRSTAAYRRQVAAVICRRALAAAAQRAGGSLA